MVKVTSIEPNREQPRKDFNEEAMGELAESMKVYGVLQPLLVQKKGDYYEIIAGERRWRPLNWLVSRKFRSLSVNIRNSRQWRLLS